MNKYGVEQSESAVKTASDKKPGKCPKCGRALLLKEEHNVLACPLCGTLPFEQEGR